MAETVGSGLTITLAVAAFEIQLLSEVATNVKIVVSGEVVMLVKFPEMVAVFPLDGIPVVFVVLSRVQLKSMVPAIPFVLLNKIGVIAAPEQADCDRTLAATVGFG